MTTRKIFYSSSLSVLTLCLVTFFLTSCDKDDPKKEDTPELITKVVLTFSPNEGDDVVVMATDPDGEGVQDLVVEGDITLMAGKTYTLSIELINELADASSPEYNITEEVSEESDEHIFFFGWTGNVFSDPAGNGNIDNRNDAVNYNDEDANGLPLGLATTWVASETEASGEFHVLLKHQPDVKSATSGSEDGETDLDVIFDISIN